MCSPQFGTKLRGSLLNLVMYVKEEFKAFLTTLCSPFCAAMYHVVLLLTTPMCAPPLPPIFSDFLWAGLPLLHQQLQYPKLSSPADPLSNRGGNWMAVSGLFSKKLLTSIIFTNIR